jgi:SRSO17 transposase
MIIPEDSPRKDDILKQLKNSLSFHIEKYYHCFQNETFDGHELGEAYIRGLFKTESGKRNMERMNEELELSGDGYQRVQQFITNSTWSAPNLISEIALNTSDLYASENDYRRCDVGYIIDESAHIKKGKNSVGVARQYAGVTGKLENCQVGVYVSLAWHSHSTLINERLFLPESWTSDPNAARKLGFQRRSARSKRNSTSPLRWSKPTSRLAWSLAGSGETVSTAMDLSLVTPWIIWD